MYMLIPACVYAGDARKWKDEGGQVHYGDQVPSEYLHKEHSLLNEQGVTVHKTEALKTEEELSAEEARRKIEQAENIERMIAERKRVLRDRVLLDTFTTEDDLAIARDARIEAIDSQISLAETLIKHDQEKLQKAIKHIENIAKSGRDIPENMHNKVIFVSRQIENNVAYVQEKKAERAEILKTFEQDLLRFRDLMAQRRKAKEKAAK